MNEWSEEEKMAFKILQGTSSIQIQYEPKERMYILKGYYNQDVFLPPITYKRICDCLQRMRGVR